MIGMRRLSDEPFSFEFVPDTSVPAGGQAEIIHPFQPEHIHQAGFNEHATTLARL